MWVKVLVVLKTRTFILATKLRQKFNRFSPFRDLTSFVTSFTAPWYMLSIQTSAFQNWQICGFCKITQKKKYSGEKTFGLWKTQESDNTDENWCLGRSRDSLWPVEQFHLSSPLFPIVKVFIWLYNTFTKNKTIFNQKLRRRGKETNAYKLALSCFLPIICKNLSCTMCILSIYINQNIPNY